MLRLSLLRHHLLPKRALLWSLRPTESPMQVEVFDSSQGETQTLISRFNSDAAMLRELPDYFQRDEELVLAMLLARLPKQAVMPFR